MPTPTSREPVKETKRVFGWRTRVSPTVPPPPLTKLKTPAGSPTSSISAWYCHAIPGESLDGLRHTVFPVTIAALAGRHPAPAPEGPVRGLHRLGRLLLRGGVEAPQDLVRAGGIAGLEQALALERLPADHERVLAAEARAHPGQGLLEGGALLGPGEVGGAGGRVFRQRAELDGRDPCGGGHALLHGGPV